MPSVIVSYIHVYEHVRVPVHVHWCIHSKSYDMSSFSRFSTLDLIACPDYEYTYTLFTPTQYLVETNHEYHLADSFILCQNVTLTHGGHLDLG